MTPGKETESQSRASAQPGSPDRTGLQPTAVRVQAVRPRWPGPSGHRRPLPTPTSLGALPVWEGHTGPGAPKDPGAGVQSAICGRGRRPACPESRLPRQGLWGRRRPSALTPARLSTSSAPGPAKQGEPVGSPFPAHRGRGRRVPGQGGDRSVSPQGRRDGQDTAMSGKADGVASCCAG